MMKVKKFPSSGSGDLGSIWNTSQTSTNYRQGAKREASKIAGIRGRLHITISNQTVGDKTTNMDPRSEQSIREMG